VRSFGIFRFLPHNALAGVTKFLFGLTGQQLLLVDGLKPDTPPLMLELTEDGDELLFMSALRAFPNRICYGNVSQDFMVNWGSSVMDASVQGFTGNDLCETIETRVAAVTSQPVQPVDHAFDARGCKVAFMFQYPEGGPGLSDEAKESGNSEEQTVEHTMAARLQRIGWTVFSVDYINQIPLSNHNRIVAMSRTPIHTWINAAGKRGALHLIDTVVSARHVDHVPLFKPVSRAAEEPSQPTVQSLFL
jgi:hypothetical protein